MTQHSDTAGNDTWTCIMQPFDLKSNTLPTDPLYSTKNGKFLWICLQAATYRV